MHNDNNVSKLKPLKKTKYITPTSTLFPRSAKAKEAEQADV
jgi:hypothetical protein